MAFVFSLLTAVGAGLDFFGVFNIPFTLPVVGYVFSALVMTGGSNLIHDLVSWVTNGKKLSAARLPRAM